MHSTLVRAGGILGAAAAALAAAAYAFASPPAMMTAHTGAKLRVLRPSQRTVVTGNSITTRVAISHFKLDCALARTANRKGVGHYHIELDHVLVNMFCANRATISLLDVRPGKHTLAFVPAANDHAEDMNAAQKTTFVYKPAHPLPAAKPLHFGAKPSIRIVSPRPGASVHGRFDLVVDVKNFKLSCALYGKPDVAGYGHWHANVDSTTKGMMGMGTMMGMSCRRSLRVSTAGLRPGAHRFFAILVDNIHAPTIGAKASVTLNVE